MRLAASGGGTGGHVYPALTVIDALRRAKPEGSSLPTLARDEILWIGSRGGIEEEMIGRAGLDFVGLPGGGVRGMKLTARVGNLVRLARSVKPARAILARFQPDVLLATGGYACVATALAAWLAKVPVVIYLPDIVPGLAIRFLGRFASRIAVTSETSYTYFRRDKVRVTGYPVRQEVYALDRERARSFLGLQPDLPVVLVFGGSRGARSINKALVAGMRDLLEVCQLVHISGRLDADWVAGAARGLPDRLRDRYHGFPFLHEMAAALVASDLAVSRAGAATMGEFPAAGLPALLVPYPYSGQHQQSNADFMSRSGAARVIADADLEERMVPAILELLADEEALEAMRESTRAMARPDAAEDIAQELWELARARLAVHAEEQA